MLMRAAAAQWPEVTEIRAVADKIRGFHTFYRNRRLCLTAATEPADIAVGRTERVGRPLRVVTLRLELAAPLDVPARRDGDESLSRDAVAYGSALEELGYTIQIVR